MVAKVWKDGEEGGTPITAAELNRIEKSLDEVATKKDLQASIPDYSEKFSEYDEFKTQVEGNMVSLGALDRELGGVTRRIDKVEEKADRAEPLIEENMRDIAQYIESDLVKKSDLEQAIVDIVQKRFGIEPA